MNVNTHFYPQCVPFGCLKHTHTTHTHMNAYTPFHTDDLLKTAKTTAPTMDEPMAKQQSVKEMRRRKKLKCILIREK